MRVDKKEPLVKVGSLVMWNRAQTSDYTCMGIVVEHQFDIYDDNGHKTTSSSFIVLWTDNQRIGYNYDDIHNEFLKVVKF